VRCFVVAGFLLTSAPRGPSAIAEPLVILHTVTHLLTIHPCVIVIALDFSKAFDTVRYGTLIYKIADLNIPEYVYNWLVSYFSGHLHCTRYGGLSLALLDISAGIIQGSSIGPASFVVNSSDLTAVKSGNYLSKYADDTYIIIPSVNVDSRLEELEYVEAWSQTNNLTLNRAKSLKIVFTEKRRKPTFQQPPTLPCICRADIKILGVTISSMLSMHKHVDNVVSSCSHSVHELHILRAHRMTTSSVHIVFKSVVVAKLVYTASSLWGYTTADD